MSSDDRYLQTVLDPIKVCAHYRPKFGQGNSTGGLTLAQFQTLYQADAFYSWFGLDHPLMYAAHKAAGGMTSVYGQIGRGCEKLFRTILQDELKLSAADVVWSYAIASTTGGKDRKLSLDGRVPLDKIVDPAKRMQFHQWMQQSASKLGVDDKVFASLTGAVFEVRQGYKSKDAKRQNADIANAAMAYTKGYMPCASVLSAQIDGDLVQRYTNERWVVLTGIEGSNDSLTSTYDFMREVVGYDLAAFFKRNKKILRAEIETVLQALLAPETT